MIGHMLGIYWNKILVAVRVAAVFSGYGGGGGSLDSVLILVLIRI